MSYKHVLVCLVVLLSPLSGVSNPVPESFSAPLNHLVRFVEDPAGDYTIDDIRERALDWQQQGNQVFNQGYSGSAWWLHLRLTNETGTSLERLLELSYAVLDRIDAYVFSAAEMTASYQMGDQFPFHARPIEHRFFVIPLNWREGETLDIYYRIKTGTSVQAPLTLWESKTLQSREGKANIIQGLYYGAMGSIAMYNLLIFLLLRERSYLYYVVVVVSFPLFAASINGQAYRYLWPNAVTWNETSIPFFLSLTFGFSILFARRFLQVQRWSGAMHLSLTVLMVLAISCAVLSFFVPYRYTILFLVPFGLLACIFCMVVGSLAWYKRVPSSRFYVIAWLSFLSGGILMSLSKLNILPGNFITEYSIQIGSVMEAVLLSFALAERINTERRLRFAAQDETLLVTQRLNEALEERVRERTLELEKLNTRLEEISNTDQLTGVKNRRYLDGVMQQEWLRCKRYGRNFSIAMLDVDFFKKVNDDYGHPAGDECLKQVAEQIKSCIRWPADELARYGGEEFCLILPETGPNGAQVVAERIRETIESTAVITEAGRINLTVSIGICVGTGSESSVEELLKIADMALYQSKEAGRNRITLLSQDDVIPLPAS